MIEDEQRHLFEAWARERFVEVQIGGGPWCLQTRGGESLKEIAWAAWREAALYGIAAEREACAALMESDVRGKARVNVFCRLTDHMQNMCECQERADAIRDRQKGTENTVDTSESVE